MNSVTLRSATVFVLALFAPGVWAATNPLPVVSVSPGLLAFRYVIGGAIPAAQPVIIASDLPASISAANVVYVSGMPGWITTPSVAASLFTTNSISIGVAPAALAPGQYVAQVQLTTAADPSSNLHITVFLVVEGGAPSGTTTGTTAPPVTTPAPTPAPAPAPSLTTSTGSLSFEYRVGAVSPSPQAITFSGASSVAVAVSTNDGKAWLTANPATSTNGTVTISVNTSGVTAGTYMGTVNLSSGSAAAQILVTFTVTGPDLTFSETSISLTQPQNYGFSAGIPVKLTAPGAYPFTAYAGSDTRWLVVDPPVGTTPATLSVRTNNSGLEQGIYHGIVTAQSGSSSYVQLPVTLVVGPPAAMSLSPSALVFTGSAGDSNIASQTTRISSLTGSTFTFNPSVDASTSWLSAVATASSTPGSVTVTVDAAKLAPGTYSGLVNVTPSVTGSVPQQIAVTFMVAAGSQPVVSDITSAASYESGAVAPGQIVTIWGANLGPKLVALAAPGPLPMSIANTAVTFDGIPAPMLYSSATQIAVQVPYGISMGHTLMKITAQSGASSTKTLTSTEVLPGLFTLDASGKGPAAALNSDLTINGAANPVGRGKVLVLYGTGEGKTDPGTVEGSVISSTPPFPLAIAPVSVLVGGKPAKVLYAGETPSSIAGLMQVNVLVPDDAPVGNAVPVQVFVGIRGSQDGVTVAIN